MIQKKQTFFLLMFASFTLLAFTQCGADRFAYDPVDSLATDDDQGDEIDVAINESEDPVADPVDVSAEDTSTADPTSTNITPISLPAEENENGDGEKKKVNEPALAQETPIETDEADDVDLDPTGGVPTTVEAEETSPQFDAGLPSDAMQDRIKDYLNSSENPSDGISVMPYDGAARGTLTPAEEEDNGMMSHWNNNFEILKGAGIINSATNNTKTVPNTGALQAFVDNVETSFSRSDYKANFPKDTYDNYFENDVQVKAVPVKEILEHFTEEDIAYVVQSMPDTTTAEDWEYTDVPQDNPATTSYSADYVEYKSYKHGSVNSDTVYTADEDDDA
ncbi:MAG: hypothetical protein ACD_62C00596G0005 [uncultured bacterium]|nr:MAG: hypothetical protein ACD_62C00596G0005 [uncultured bacterium]HLD45680.1 hypothetical protein [bacterium]